MVRKALVLGVLLAGLVGALTAVLPAEAVPPNQAAGVTLSIAEVGTGRADASGTPGSQVTMRVRAEGTETMQGLQFKVIYDPSVLGVLGISTTTEGGLPGGFLFQVGTTTAGEATVAIVGDHPPILGEHVEGHEGEVPIGGFDVADIVFELVGNSGATSPLTFADALAGDSSVPPQDIPVTTVPGSILVAANAIKFEPELIGLSAIGSIATIDVAVQDVSPEVNGIQLNIQHPTTLEVLNPACAGVFVGGVESGPTSVTGGTLIGCALSAGVINNTAGVAMTFGLKRVADFTEAQLLTFGLDGSDGTELSISGVGAPPSSTNTLTVTTGVAVTGVTTLQFRASAEMVEVEVVGDTFNATAMADASGAWEISGVPAGTYTLTASAPSYLSAQVSGLVVGTTSSVAVPAKQLLAGDINANDFVEINDITGTISNFGKGSPQTWAGDPTAGAGTGIVSGATTLQFRSSAELVSLTLTGNGFTDTTKADSAGNWAFTGVPAGAYTLTASAFSYLSAERTGLAIGADEDVALPANELLAGDINGNNFVEINDITGTISNFGKGAPQTWPGP